LKNFRNLKLSYSKRISRPSLRFVNPFNNSIDRTNVSVGNPFLDPEITHQYEVGYNTRVAGFNIFGSGYFKRTNGIIEQVLGVNEQGISVNTFNNVGTNNSFGVNMFVNKSINKLTVRFGGDIFTYDGEGVVNGEPRENSALQYQLFTNGEYSFSGTVKADFFGFFRSDQATLQGSTPSFSIFGVGLRKDFGKQWSLGIRIIEPFAENKGFNTALEGANFSQVSAFTIPFRSFGMNVRYKFGKVDFKERRSKIRNTDQKSDGQGQGQQGGGGPVGG
ncbi:MAG: outer membrane beta-barrel family protein, partial [Bacteroidota bacterium]